MFFYSPFMGLSDSGGGAPGVITLEGQSATEFTNQASVSAINFSTTGYTHSSGDIAVVIYGWADSLAANSNLNCNITAGSNFTEIADLYANDNTQQNTYAGYYVLAGGETSFDITAGPNSNGSAVVHLFIFSGVDNVTPLDVTPTTSQTLNTTRPTPPSITPITAGSLILCSGCGGHIVGNIDFTSADFDTFYSDTAVGSLSDVTVGSGVFAWTSGAFTPSQYGWSGVDASGYSNCSVSIALRPA